MNPPRSGHSSSIIQVTPKSKDEIYSYSCMDLKNSRKKMKSKIQLASTLGSITEEDENGGEHLDVVHPDRNTRAVQSDTNIIRDLSNNGEVIPKKIEIESNKTDINGNVVLGKTSMHMGRFSGNIEVTIKSDDRTAKVCLSNIRQNVDSIITVHGFKIEESGSVLSNVDLHIPIAETESMKMIEVTDTACQVGISLEKIAKAEKEAKEMEMALCRSNSRIDLSQSFEAVSDGVNATFNAVKQIVIGLIPEKTPANNVMDSFPDQFVPSAWEN